MILLEEAYKIVIDSVELMKTEKVNFSNSLGRVLAKDIFSDIGENPFIIEGYLYSESESQSISIKQIDGQYFISKIDLAGIDLKNLPDDIFAQHCYLSDPAIFKLNNDFKYIKFVEYWESKPDDLCAGMQVLQPARIAFIGFSKEECDAK